MPTTYLKTGMWLLSTLVVLLAVIIWWPGADQLSAYTLFPLFGLVAFSLMWSHYIGGALRLYLGMDSSVLRRHFLITGYIVLFCILAHPALLDIKLFLDGLGTPIESLPAAYPAIQDLVAIYIGMAALLCFLFYELHRFFSEKTWWKYVEWANVAAMAGILWHGFTLGGDFGSPWFRGLWALYALSFAAAVIHTEYRKRKDAHAKNIVT